jgi:protein SCO1
MKLKMFALCLFLIFCFHGTPVSSARQKPAAVVYSCPMHPEVKAKKKGRCPKCKMDLVVEKATTTSVKLNIPDVKVLDQDGNERQFYTDLVKGKTVAINFIFTNCTTICPPLGATVANVQRELGDKVGKDVHFISVSVDPVTDTPERLKAWAAKFKAGAGWTFVTGNKPEMDQLLQALGASVARREDHTPSMLIGNDAKGEWTRTYGLAKTSQIVGVIQNAIGEQVNEAAAKYFSDVELINQDGQKLRFYSDVLKNKVIVMNAFFTTCAGVCPPMARNMERVQAALGDRLGKDILLVSITVDPETDTPAKLKEYSRRFHAKPGWLFLTGKKENVDWALYKLGQFVEAKEQHTSIIIVGNEPKGLWKKAFGLAKSEELVSLVEGVINDR